LSLRVAESYVSSSPDSIVREARIQIVVPTISYQQFGVHE
jgi:hypothetical protein